MTVTIFDILVIAVLVFGLFAGMRKGFIASFLTIAGFIGSWFLAKTYYPRLAAVALNNEGLMSTLREYLEIASNQQIGSTTVGEFLSKGTTTVNGALNTLSGKLNLSLLLPSFDQNLSSADAAATVGQTLETTILTAAFNILSFILIFVFACLAVNLIVNLLNHVIRFPVLRGFDALLGGAFGLARAALYAILIMALAEIVVEVFVPTYLEKLQDGRMYGILSKIDFIHARDWVRSLLM